AGVATRSVFHHFDDLESLYADAAETQTARHWSILQPVSGDLARRIDGVIAQRAELYERISGTRRGAGLHEHESPVLAERLRESRAALRRHIRTNLPELNDLDRPAREAVAAVTSWEAWEVVRRHQGLSIDASRTAVSTTVSALLAAANVTFPR